MTNLNRLGAGRNLLMQLLTKHADKFKHHVKMSPQEDKPKPKEKKD